MDIAQIEGLHKRLGVLSSEIETLKKDYQTYSDQELKSRVKYELEGDRLWLKYKADKNPYNILKPTKEDLEKMIHLDLEELYIDMLLGRKQKEVCHQKYKMCETQISTIQSRMSFVKQEMSMV